ncbi:MAG TPA: 4Fe-4S single cluster domain-containing protein, partial [Nannocystaceae bacterium]|nr:4Fe-4S single cluster domain-containing protein [Nannocystaceae bacterium]
MTALAIAGWVPCTIAEGPHRRFAVWVQGCTLACPGCCNPELWSRSGGRTIEVAALVDAVLAARERSDIEGITVIGGEPLEQLAGVAALAHAVARTGLGVVVFTGYTLALAQALPGFAALWDTLDTLVDGRFDARARARETRRFVGSTNQQLVHRTARYADPALWLGPRTAELVVAGD